MTQFDKVLKDQEVLEGQFVELDVKVNRKVTSVCWLKDEDVLTRTTSGKKCLRQKSVEKMACALNRTLDVLYRQPTL